MNFEALRNTKFYIIGELRNELLRNNILILRRQISRIIHFELCSTLWLGCTV